MTELVTIGELEERIKKLEERIFMHDKAIKRLFDLLRGTNGAQSTKPKEDRKPFKTESDERLNRIMKELGYKIE